jgi:hypothetical protein
VEVSQTPYKGCTHPIEKQRYKGLLKRNGQKKTQNFQSRVYNDAIKELLAWKDELPIL